MHSFTIHHIFHNAFKSISKSSPHPSHVKSHQVTSGHVKTDVPHPSIHPPCIYPHSTIQTSIPTLKSLNSTPRILYDKPILSRRFPLLLRRRFSLQLQSMDTAFLSQLVFQQGVDQTVAGGLHFGFEGGGCYRYADLD